MFNKQNLTDESVGTVSLDLFNTLNESIQKYTDLFCKKHDLEFEFWVADQIGTVVCLSNEFYVNFDDIRLDLEKNATMGLFFEWYDEVLEAHSLSESHVNYYTFLKLKQ